MPSERSRSPSESSPIPKININPPLHKNNGNLIESSSSNKNDLLDTSNPRVNGSRDKSPSRDRSPGRNNKRGKSPSPNSRPKSPSSSASGDKLLDTPKNSNSNRSRSPGRNNKNSSGNNNNSSSRSKSRDNNNRDNFNSRSHDARANLTPKEVLQRLLLNNKRISLPANPSEINSVIKESNERWAKINLISTDDGKEGGKGSMGNFYKPTLRVAPSLFGSKSMQRNPSDQPTGRSTDSSPLVHGGFSLTRSRSYNSGMENANTRVNAKFSKEEHPLQHSWYV